MTKVVDGPTFWKGGKDAIMMNKTTPAAQISLLVPSYPADDNNKNENSSNTCKHSIINIWMMVYAT